MPVCLAFNALWCADRKETIIRYIKNRPYSSWGLKRLNFEVEYQKRWIQELQQTISTSRKDILALKKEIKLKRDSKRVRTWKKKMNGLLKKTLQKKNDNIHGYGLAGQITHQEKGGK